MKLLASITAAAACLVVSVSALPAAADAENGPARAFWGMPIVDHEPVPGARRRAPKMHIIDKIPVPEERRDVEVERRDRDRPVVEHRPVDRRAEEEDEEEEEEGEEGGAKTWKEGTGQETWDEGSGQTWDDGSGQENRGGAVADAFWGMPIVDHRPVPGTRRSEQEQEQEQQEEEEEEEEEHHAARGFPVVDHRPVPDDK